MHVYYTLYAKYIKMTLRHLRKLKDIFARSVKTDYNELSIHSSVMDKLAIE